MKILHQKIFKKMQILERYNWYETPSNEEFDFLNSESVEPNTVTYKYATEKFHMKQGENYLPIASKEKTMNWNSNPF